MIIIVNKNKHNSINMYDMGGLCMDEVGKIKVLSPIDGDMLNEYDGIIVNGRLQITVKITAPSSCKIKVNGAEAIYKDGIFSAIVCLDNYRNVIDIVEESIGYKETLTVFWLRNYTKKYRVSLDDNIWFLRDIAQNSNLYKSIFENPYLSFFKQVHDTYGTKIHINIYYQTEGFNLSQMPAKYKGEWKDNADWLRLSFHALQDVPDKPYINAGYDEVKRDCEMIMEEIRRFAGEEMIGPVTTLHWGEATVEGCKALRDAGYSGLVGDFNVDNNMSPVSYYFDIEKRRHINKRFIWKDTQQDIIFVRSNIIIDCHKQNEITSFLDELLKDPHKSGYMDLLIHEQYFYPYYIAYQPNYRDKVLTAVQWAVDNGYKPAFLSDCIFE